MKQSVSGLPMLQYLFPEKQAWKDRAWLFTVQSYEDVKYFPIA